jgi:predicted nucleic-acid-binding protein
MRAVDTNALVRLLTQNDTRQAAAAGDYIALGAWVSHLVLAEASWVLGTVYDRNARQIADAVAMLLEHDALVLQDPDVVSAALEHFRKRPSPGFSDCLILEIARKAGHLPLGTFDGKLSKLEGCEKIA